MSINDNTYMIPNTGKNEYGETCTTLGWENHKKSGKKILVDLPERIVVRFDSVRTCNGCPRIS